MYIHTYVCIYIQTHIHTYMHTFIHTHTNTCIHTYTGAPGGMDIIGIDPNDKMSSYAQAQSLKPNLKP